MSFKQMRARIDRLEHLAKLKEPKWKLPYDFTIDPELAKTILDLDERLWENFMIYLALGIPDASTRNDREISARIKELMKPIRCPSEYDTKQHEKDCERLEVLQKKRRSISGRLTSEERAEELQLVVRTGAFTRPRSETTTTKNLALPPEIAFLDDHKPPKPLTPEEEDELIRVTSLCKVQPLCRGKPFVTCADPKVKFLFCSW